jgi:uncharacterized protein (TIRG00374 family)
MGRRTALLTILATGLLLWFLRHASLDNVWYHVRGARMDLLLVALGVVLSGYWIRAVRWQYLLAPLGPTRFRTAFRTTVIGFAALALLPARAGDVIRPYLLARQEGLDVSATFATIVLERVLDLVAVLALLAVFVWGLAGIDTLPPAIVGPLEISAATAAGVAAGLLVLAWLLASHPERVGRSVRASERFLPAALAHRLGDLARTFSGGFAAARVPRGFLLAVFWSFPLWLAIAAETWLMTLAIGIDLPYGGSFLLQGLLVIGVAVPTPGGVGSYHEAYRIGVTTLFGAPADRAVAGALVTHALSYLPVVLLGVLFMIQDGLALGRLGRLAGAAREKELATSDEVPVLRSPGR